MNSQVIISSNNEIEKRKYYCYKNSIFIVDEVVDIDKISMFNKTRKIID